MVAGVLAWLSRDTFPVLPILPHHALCVVREDRGNLIIALANLGTDMLKDCSFNIYAIRSPGAILRLDKNGDWEDAVYSLTKKDRNIYELSLCHGMNVFEWSIFSVEM